MCCPCITYMVGNEAILNQKTLEKLTEELKLKVEDQQGASTCIGASPDTTIEMKLIIAFSVQFTV